MTALNPVLTIGWQIGSAAHRGLNGEEAKAVAALLERVGIPPEQRYSDYPHQLSGGMRRGSIAIALACRGELLMPTSRPPPRRDGSGTDHGFAVRTASQWNKVC